MKGKFFIFFLLLIKIASGQIIHCVDCPDSQSIDFRSFTDYRNELAKTMSNGDTIKETRCKENIPEFIRLKKLYLQKIDSMNNVILEKNNTGSGYYYYTAISNRVFYNWGDCYTKVINDSISITYSPAHGNRGDIIDSKFEIRKIDKFRVHFGASGQTYYREDIH